MPVSKNKWLLPVGVEDLLPDQAWALEYKRREILDIFASNGYQLVQPPLLEYMDSLLTGAGRDLDLLTYKVTDQDSGRLMGIRADMTPQLSRIDAHVLNQPGPSRLCYAGPVVQTQHRSGFHSREPMQFGAELFGCGGAEADVEIIRLCADVFSALGIGRLHFDLGHVGIFRALASQAQLDVDQTDQLLDICLRKSWPDMDEFIREHHLDESNARMFLELLSLEGASRQVFDKAANLFSACDPAVRGEFDEFRELVRLLESFLPELEISVDFLELRGINYHTGAVFSVYCDDSAHAIAKGGRYDDVGAAFGRARPATGFSADLRHCMALLAHGQAQDEMIFAPFNPDPALSALINELRCQGNQVMIGLQDEEHSNYPRRIVRQDGQWVLKSKGASD